MTENKQTAGETAVQTFTFNATDTAIRVKMVENEPWFVAKDVCEALNIKWSGSSVTLSQIPDDWKGVLNFKTPGGNQELTCIKEAGMYKLAFRCQSSEVADKFTNWVASEILPAIRRTGRYELKKSAPAKTHNYPRRGELITADLVNLLWLIGESLEHGDQAQIALELGVSRNTVSGTLNGKIRSSRVLRALYRKAMQRREEFMLYHRPDKMAERLIGGDRSSLPTQLPTVHIAGCKGLLGCQNARKKNKKGGAL